MQKFILRKIIPLLTGIILVPAFLIISLPANPVSATSKLRVTIDNGVALRLVDKTGQTEINNLNLELIATPSGAFVSDYLNAEVSTANRTGYKLYITSNYQVSSSDSTTYTNALVNTEDSSYTIPSLSSTVSLTDFSKANSSYVNNWGYSLDNTTYIPIPEQTSTDLIRQSDTEANKELTPVYFGVNANMSNSSGTYRNVLVFSAIANPIPTDYTLYFQSGVPTAEESTVTNLPSTMTSSEVAAQHTFIIPSIKPTRPGYNFTGYLDESTSVVYQAGDTITIIGDEEYVGSATLVAQWEVADPWPSISTMQQMTSALCEAAEIGATKTLTDTRDSNTYTVKKLKDGKCWMTQNLKLTGPITISPEDSDVSANWALPEVDTAFPESCGYTAYNMESSNYPGKYAKYGNYYNWYAATAGTGRCERVTGSASSSICPRGWMLPRLSTFQALTDIYDTVALMQDDPGIVFSGHRSRSATVLQDTNGEYWTGTAYGSSLPNLVYILRVRTTSDEVILTGDDKYDGRTVRCVAR